ncbi:branched-chain amino acid ABC transporter permease [Variovorax sp. KK3]|uniref:branched-chain amino acid ABC transporter permease n=1 Tax=Variovorax sp. KK3 TaxID=1855728 RepID=UPI0009F8AB44|nr:branched-chain amino acid ABC transporter permease [Variovorax sp. KK3]
MSKKLALMALFLAAVYALGNPYLVNLFVVAAMFALPALGLSLLMGYTGQISLGHAAFVGLGAYGSALAARSLGLDPWLSMLLATALSTLAAWAIGWLVFRLRGHHLAMATLAFGIIVHVGLVEWRSLTGGQDGVSDIHPLRLGGLALNTDFAMYPLVWLVCLVGMVLAHNLVRSPAGLSMRTVAENESVAGSIGIASARLKRQIMALSGAYAGLGGALYAHWLGYISPGPFDVGFSIRLLLIVALGGFAGTWSVLFGVFFVVLISEVLKPFGRYDVVIYGVLLVVVMIYCPRGLLAGLADAYRRVFPAPASKEHAA